jgi:hypothetical protein
MGDGMSKVGIDKEESASCYCRNCSWVENDNGHLEVLQGANHAAEHAFAYGHVVIEEQMTVITVTGPSDAAA